MEKVKTISLTKVGSKALLFAVFLAIALAAPFIGVQIITGSIVNAVLFVSTGLLGITSGILIGFLPSIISLFAGLFPVTFYPMVPYIIIGNAILVLTFGVLAKKHFVLGVILAAFLKFLFLFLSSSLVVSFFVGDSFPKAVVAMMGYPQLITALAGGVIAFFVSK